MTIDDWRVKYEILSAENDKLRAEVERLRRDVDRFWGLQERAQYRLAEFESELYAAREDAARARWCEEMKAAVGWNRWTYSWDVLWYDRANVFRQVWHPDRNAAIDAARGKV